MRTPPQSQLFMIMAVTPTPLERNQWLAPQPAGRNAISGPGDLRDVCAIAIG